MKKYILAFTLISSLSVSLAYADNNAGSNTWGNIGNAANSDTSSYCGSNVSKALMQAQGSSVQYQKALAASMIPIDTEGYMSQSCLDNLLKSGLNIFNNVSISSLLDNIVNMACSMGINAAQQAVAPLSTNLMSSLPTGNILPGVGMGDLNFGMGFSPTIGGGNQGVSVYGGGIGDYNAGSELSKYLGSEGQPYQVNWPQSWQDYTKYKSNNTSSQTGSSSSSWFSW
jgi:hypothetical protein